ncbi:trypsin-like serine peptidase [Streptomyces sp. NPDC002206]
MPVSRKWTGPTISYPLNVVGKLFFTKKDGTSAECTASVIVSNTKSALWTAAHCLHDGMSGQDGVYTNIAFAPAYNGSAESPAPWGIWDANNLIVPTAFANGDSDRYFNADFGAVIVDSLEGYETTQDALGGFGYRFGFGSDYNQVYDFGDPGHGYNRPDSDFNEAANSFYCYGNAEDAFNWNPLDNRIKVDCDMGEGSSGGPLLDGFPQNIKIVGANSHYEVNDADERISDDLYSSEHGSRATSVINTVNGL